MHQRCTATYEANLQHKPKVRDHHNSTGNTMKCQQCRQPLEEWEAGFCEGCGMKKSEAKQHAKDIVFGMLGGRCCPEPDDVSDRTGKHSEQQMIIDEIQKILDRMSRSVAPKEHV